MYQWPGIQYKAASFIAGVDTVPVLLFIPEAFGKPEAGKASPRSSHLLHSITEMKWLEIQRVSKLLYMYVEQ